MEAHTIDKRLITTRAMGPLSNALARGGVLLATVLLATTAVLLLIRRMSGALQKSLDPPALIITGLMLATVLYGLRSVWRRLPQPVTHTWFGRIVSSIPTVSWIVLLATLTYPTVFSPDSIFCWSLLLTADVFARVGLHEHRTLWRKTPSTLAEADEPTMGKLDLANPCDEQQVIQQLTRIRQADGSDLLYGHLRAVWQPGEKSQAVHVAFCPPFSGTPQLDVGQVDGPQVQIKVAQLLPYGVRLEVRLAHVTQTPTSALLEMTAQHTLPCPSE